MMQNILERLAEMFPKQTYQAKLDKYIASKNPQNAADVDVIIKEYEQKKEVWGHA